MKKPPKADYCIEVQFEKGSKDPARVFRTIQELIETFHEFDQALIGSIDSNIEPILILEDIEAGSVRLWLSNLLEAVDDDALKNLDWKPAVGKYLVKAKYITIDFLRGKTKISSATELKQLEGDLKKSAEETNVKWLPIYEKIPTPKLLNSLSRISSSLLPLHENDKASYIISENERVDFNLELKLLPESLENLVTKDKIVSKAEMILKVKKPDYLGESKWEFRHGGRSFPAKIIHREWLEEFQSRKVDIRPGDSIKADIEITNKYDFDGELISTDYNILKVTKIIQSNSPEQLDVFDQDEGSYRDRDGHR